MVWCSITSFRWKPSWYQNETGTVNEIERSINRVCKPVHGKRPMKRRGVGGRDVTISFRREIIKMASQQKNESDLAIYTEQMQYLQKLISNIGVRREVRNVADMMEFHWASILQ